MKKIVFIVASLALVLVCSCKKDLEITTEQPSNNSGYELVVSIADYTDAETKASINSASGAFAWDANDKISVTNGTDVYEFTYAGDVDGKARFTTTATVSGTLTKAFYPYENSVTPKALPTEINGLEGALSAENIRLEGDIVDNQVTLAHSNALLKVTFTNVPTFASAIKFYEEAGNTVTVSFDKLSEKGPVTAFIPVNVGTANFTAQLLDDAGNVIISKYATGKTFSAGTLKKMKALEVGHVITMTDENSIENAQIHTWDSSSHGATFKKGNTYPYKLNEYPGYSGAGNKYYVVFNTIDFSWAGEGAFVGVQFSDENWNNKTQTDGVYLYRDIDFTSPSGNAGMRTNYRVYPHGGNYTTPYIYVYNITDQADVFGSWPGKAFTKYDTISGYAYIDFDSELYGKKVRVVFSDNGSDQKADWDIDLNRDYDYGL